MGHRAPAHLGLRIRDFLLYQPQGAYGERRVARALREGSGPGRCRHQRADIGAGDRRCEAPRSAGGSWTSSDAQRIEEAENSALQSSPRSQTEGVRGGLQPRLGGGDGYGCWNLESKEAWRERRSFSFAVLSDAIPSPLARAIRGHVSGGWTSPCACSMQLGLRDCERLSHLLGVVASLACFENQGFGIMPAVELCLGLCLLIDAFSCSCAVIWRVAIAQAAARRRR